MILCGLSLNDLKPECISEEICAQIVSLLEDQPQSKGQIDILKRYFYHKELMLYSCLVKNKYLEVYRKAKEDIQAYEERKLSNGILSR